MVKGWPPSHWHFRQRPDLITRMACPKPHTIVLFASLALVRLRSIAIGPFSLIPLACIFLQGVTNAQELLLSAPLPELPSTREAR